MKRTSIAMSTGILFLMFITMSLMTFDAYTQTPNTKQLNAEFDKMLSEKVVDAQIEFVPDADGKVSKMILNQGGQRMEAKRIK